MSAVHRTIAVFLVGGAIAVLVDKYAEKPLDKIEKKVAEAID